MIPAEKCLRWGVLLIFTIGSLAACASYPSDPKSPTAVPDEYTLEEDGVLTVAAEHGVLVNDSPGEGTGLILTTIDELTTDAGGRLVMISDGGFTYEPKADFHGTDQVDYTIRNSKGKEAVGTIALIVTPINDAPGISPIAEQTTPENVPIDVAFTVSDDETGPQDLIITAVSDNPILVPSGAMVINGSGADRTLTVTPAADQYGVATITLTVSEGNSPGALTAQTDFVLEIVEVNAPPTIEPIGDQTTSWLSPITFPITIGDRETPAEQLELVGTSINQELVEDRNIVFGGTGPARTVTITPNSFVTGNVAISITVWDGGDSEGNNRLSAEAGFTLTIEFFFLPDNAELSSGKTIVAGLDNGATSIDILSAFHRGAVNVAADGSITATSPAGLADSEIFLNSSGVREATDGTMPYDIRRFPAAKPDYYETASETALEVLSDDGLLANDADFADLELTIAEPGLFDTLFGGTVYLWPDGGFSYEPPPDFTGTDGFTYSVTNSVNSVMGIAIVNIAP